MIALQIPFLRDSCTSEEAQYFEFPFSIFPFLFSYVYGRSVTAFPCAPGNFLFPAPPGKSRNNASKASYA
jgi:hypothetical protein